MDFPFPKPVALIKEVLHRVSKSDSLILDFFAGSGTTAQAVLELNREDNGTRRFVLCTNNENNICDSVTYPRVSTIISGKRPDGSVYAYNNQACTVLLDRKITMSDLKKPTIYDEIVSEKADHEGEFHKFSTEIKNGHVYLYGIKKSITVEGIAANLLFYQTDFIAKDEEYLSDALLEHIREMIQLEHGVKIDGSQYLMVMSDEEADELQARWSEYEDVKAIYASKEVLFTTEQNALFAGVEIHTIPDYYFNFELKEVGEAW